MASWEERMAAKTKARLAAEAAAHNARVEVEQEEQDRRDREQCQADYEAGPPCPECFEWQRCISWPWLDLPPYAWVHRPIETEDGMCWHECHGPEGEWHPLVAIAL